jgi:hypothetical protein
MFNHQCIPPPLEGNTDHKLIGKTTRCGIQNLLIMTNIGSTLSGKLKMPVAISE